MDESVEKGLKLLSVNGSDASIPKSSEIGRIIVTGYDTGLPHDDVESALRKHLSACGEITDIYVPINYRWDNTLRKCSFVYFLGEDAVDKALQLNGIDVGGWNVCAKPFPFPPHAKELVSLTVQGYDTSLSEIDNESALSKLFSSCGNVIEVIATDNGSALLRLFGKDAAEMAPKLSGSLMGGHKLVVQDVSLPLMSTVHRRCPPGQFRCGPTRPTRPGKKSKLTAE